VLARLHRDLSRRYSDAHVVACTESSAEALGVLRNTRLRNQPVALVLCDVDMPEGGAELLGRARALHPDTRALLLARYDRVDQAVAAIAAGDADDYVVKPWDPAEERLYPLLDDLLAVWAAGYLPVFTGVRVVGHRWSPDAHAIRDFLARYQVPYQWLDVESEPEAARVLDATGSNSEATGAVLPMVVLPDGMVLRNPSLPELARALRLSHTPATTSYDVVVVGAGPAGLAAAVYAASEGLRVAVIDRDGPGGQAGLSARIENYLGFPGGVAGGELARRAVTQARRFGADMISPVPAASLQVGDTYRQVALVDGETVAAEAVILACGVAFRRLDVPGAERLTNRGVYYGAGSADAPFCSGERVAIVGGGNSAGQSALNFARFASSVTLLVREDSLARDMSAYLVERIAGNPAISVRLCSEVAACEGDERLDAVRVRDNRSGNTERLEVSLLFVFIGNDPATSWLQGVLELDGGGFLLTGSDLGERAFPTASGRRDPYSLETSAPGVFAAGDVRHGSMKRVAAAVGEGSTAVSYVHRYLDR
jgi:thioredoxin reductase (NADPH)